MARKDLRSYRTEPIRKVKYTAQDVGRLSERTLTQQLRVAEDKLFQEKYKMNRPKRTEEDKQYYRERVQSVEEYIAAIKQQLAIVKAQR